MRLNHINNAYTCIYMGIDIFTHIMYMHLCCKDVMYVCMYVCMCVCIYVHVCMYVCMNVWMYMHDYMYVCL